MKITKKILFATSVIMMCAYVNALASTVEFTIGDTDFASEKEGIISNNTIEAPPFINDSGRTMVPVRAISDAFGAQTGWNAEKREVSVVNGDKEIKLTIDSQTAYVNNSAITLDCVPVIVNDRTFVPLRFIGEAFSYNVNFAPSTRQVIIDDTPVVFSCGDKVFTLAELKTFYNILYQTASSSAEQSGDFTEESLKEYVLEGVLSNSYDMIRIYNAFSDVNFTEADLNEIRIGIEADSLYSKNVMTGLNALIHEKYYFASGESIINNILSNTDIEEIYNRDYICAKHVLVEDEKVANDIYKKAAGGEDFNSLVKEYGTDPGMESNPQGYVFTKGEMIEEFEASAYSLKVGEISKPIQTTYGYHIIKREALPSLDEEAAYYIASSIADEILKNSPVPEQKLSTEELYNLI